MTGTARSWKAAAVPAAVFAALLLAVLLAGASDGPRSPSRPGDLPTFHLDTDHPTYSSVGSVSAAADLIVRGTVLSHTTEAGKSPGVDALGDPLPPVPRTNYAVSVLEVVKGGTSAGATIVVSLSGGTTEDGQFILDGAPEIHDGDTAMFFLEAGGDGRYYPLAGGAAVAPQSADGSFALPPDATGADPVSFTHITPPAGDGGNPGGGAPTAAIAAATAAAAPARRKPPRRCRKNFRKRMVQGRKRCVRIKKHRRNKAGKATHGPRRLP